MNKESLIKLLQSNDKINIRIAATIVMAQENPDDLWDELVKSLGYTDVTELPRNLFWMSRQSKGYFKIDRIIYIKDT